jgi:hypothetical protein
MNDAFGEEYTENMEQIGRFLPRVANHENDQPTQSDCLSMVGTGL